MITKKAAQLIVEREINKSSDEIERLIVFDHSTLERDWGWVMFYGTEENYYLEAGTDTNPAFLINRVTGELSISGKSWPIEKYIEDYETRLGSIQT